VNQQKATRYAVLVVLVAALLGLIGVINAPEVTRPRHYDKGVYGGTADGPLDPETVQALRQRSLNMRY